MEVINPNLTPLTAFETLELRRNLRDTQDESLRSYEESLKESSNLRLSTNQTDRDHLNPKNVTDLIKSFIQHFESIDPTRREEGRQLLPQSVLTKRSLIQLIRSIRDRFGQVNGSQNGKSLNGLTKAERLQICDLCPTELVEIYLIVEECDSRFTESEIEEILSIVKDSLKDKSKKINGTLKSNGKKREGGVGGGGIRTGDERVEEGLGFEDSYGFDENQDFDNDVDGDDDLVVESHNGNGLGQADIELDEVPD